MLVKVSATRDSPQAGRQSRIPGGLSLSVESNDVRDLLTIADGDFDRMSKDQTQLFLSRPGR
jgi:hypothetical protein